MKIKFTVFSYILLVVFLISSHHSSAQQQAQEEKETADTLIESISEAKDIIADKSYRYIVDSSIIVPKLDFSDVRLADALTALARAYNITMAIDSSVTGTINIRLDNVSLNDALAYIFQEHNLAWDRVGDIIKVFRLVIPPPPPVPLNLNYENGLLSFDLKSANLVQFVEELTTLTGLNVLIEGGTIGKLSGKLTDMKVERALKVILQTNGFNYRKVEGVIYVSPGVTGEQAAVRARHLFITCENSKVSVDVTNSPLRDVVSVIASECAVSLLIQTKLEGSTSARFTKKSISEALTYILLNSPYTYKEVDSIYFIGKRDSEDLHVTKLFKLDHLIATTLEPLIPVSLSKQLTVKVVKEHNGLLVTGPLTSISRLKSFLREVDVPTAQVLFDVLVVDYTLTKRNEFEILANNFGGGSGLPGETYFPYIDLHRSGDQLNTELSNLSNKLRISNLGKLSIDFYLNLKILQEKGIANIISHPRIATLNGHTASITIGTTQYYLLESKTIYPSQQPGISTQTSQRFETINADMKLEVTPFVNRNGDLIVHIKPEFNTPAASFDPDVPPTINRRVLNSTVRLKNGETIVLGGLVQTSKTENVSKWPLLGSIPILGRIFRNHSTVEIQSELMIYITPHVYFGSEGSIDIQTILDEK